jgi:hypothetical protein
VAMQTLALLPRNDSILGSADPNNKQNFVK